MIKKLYRKYKASKENAIVRLHRQKTFLMEWIAILKKRKLYRDVKWTQEQQQAFDQFWITHYGKKISNRWHKLYQSINGVFNVSYFPDILFSTKLEPKLNSFQLAEILQSKAFPELLFSKGLNNSDFPIRVPATYALGYEGYLYDEKRNPCNLEHISQTLRDVGECILKPAKDGSSGHGFRILDLTAGIDRKTGALLNDILTSYQGNFIIQEKVQNCKAVEALYPDAVNTFRVITYILEGKLFHCPLSLRVGSGGGEVDNIHAGGMGIGIGDDGTLRNKAYKLGYCDNKDYYTKHPDTDIVFSGYLIPNIDRVIQAAYNLHGCMPGIGIISWDFILNEREEPVVIETNLIGQAVWFPQVVNKEPVFCENTNRMIKLLHQ